MDDMPLTTSTSWTGEVEYSFDCQSPKVNDEKAKKVEKEIYDDVFRNNDPIPNANLRYKTILEENARAEMVLYSPAHNRSAQRVGRLYGTGVSHPLVGNGVELEQYKEKSGDKGSPVPKNTTSAIISNVSIPERRGEGKERGGIHHTTISLEHSTAPKHRYPSPVQSNYNFSAYPSHDGSGGGVDSKNIQPLKAAAALGMLDKQVGGKYHVPSHIQEPYAEQLLGKPQGSVFTKTTPLMWDLHKNNDRGHSSCTKSCLFQNSITSMDLARCNDSSALPVSYKPLDVGSPNYNQHAMQSAKAASKDKSDAFSRSHHGFERNHSDFGMSALQQTLVDCGKLKQADEQHQSHLADNVYKSLKNDIQQTKKHALWLKHKQNLRGRKYSSENSVISGLEDNAGSFFSSHFDDPIDSQGNFVTENQVNKKVRSRANEAIKTLRQRKTTHSKSSGSLSYQLKGSPSMSQRFRGNSSVMKIKGSQLDEGTQSAVMKSGIASRSREKSNYSTTKKLASGKSISILKENRVGQVPQAKNFNEDMASHLNVVLASDSNNPHRAHFRGDSDVKFGCHQSLKVLQNKAIDPKMYTKSSMNTQYGTYNVTIKEPVIKDLPSKEYINKAMTQISKQVLISYSTRIVETGAALRALQSSKHEKPGIAAILALHSAMISAAAFNPSVWELSRIQFKHVLNEQIPWFENEAVERLASAYDPQKSGVIKYSRLSASLMAGNRPAMGMLMTTISRDPDKVDGSGNVFLLRFLHSLYEDCDGGVIEEIASTLEKDTSKCMKIAKPNSKIGLGIKLEDVPEILCICAASVEDENLMKDMAIEVVQVLYEYGKAQNEDFSDVEERYRRILAGESGQFSGSQSTSQCEPTVGDNDSLNREAFSSTSSTISQVLREKELNRLDLNDRDSLFASRVLKYDKLKSINTISRVSQNAFIKCVTRHPTVMKEFGKQVERFRELMIPSHLKGSITYEESLSQNSTYGTVIHSH